jgi:mRNA interferase RelE/StbE
VKYDVRFRPSTERDLRSLPRDIQARILGRLRALADDPWPPESEPLHGDLRGLWRLRIGDYRASYVIDEEAQAVRVGRVGHRSTFHKRLRGR